ncbi:hypothetical protein HDU76_012857 [Blyttiomyces sp. JEL0837]|nr:hypothetical protein HDU76_012857 [Blyttiomyces sp. JEL0837]
MENIGPINICKQLIKELRQLEQCKKKDKDSDEASSLRFHPFPYDWRRELQWSSDSLIEFVEGILQKNGGKPVTVIAHSMGGLVTIRAVNHRPELFKGVIFEGTPFGPVPLILWALRRGAPLIPNAALFGPDLHFGCRFWLFNLSSLMCLGTGPVRSAYVFLPKDGTGLIDAKGNDIILDYFDPIKWRDHRISTVFKRPSPTSPQPSPSPFTKATDLETESNMAYLTHALTCAQSFHQSIQHKPHIKYPPFVVVRSTKWPTPAKFRSSLVHVGKHHGHASANGKANLNGAGEMVRLKSISEMIRRMPSTVSEMMGNVASGGGGNTSNSANFGNKTNTVAGSEVPASGKGEEISLQELKGELTENNADKDKNSNQNENGNVNEPPTSWNVSNPAFLNAFKSGVWSSWMSVMASESAESTATRNGGNVGAGLPNGKVGGGGVSKQMKTDDGTVVRDGIADGESPLPKDVYANKQKTMEPQEMLLEEDTGNDKPSPSTTEPTPKSHSHSHSTIPPELRIHLPVVFVPGDGVVAASSTNMPDGYEYDVVETELSHPGMMNDLVALGKAFDMVERKWSERNGAMEKEKEKGEGKLGEDVGGKERKSGSDDARVDT